MSDEKFEVVSGALYISDPCYDQGTWCQAHVDNVKNGTWIADCEKSDEGSWGNRCAILFAHEEGHTAYPYSGRWHRVDAEIGVDSGQAGIFDAGHFRDDSVVEPVENPLTGEGWYDMSCAVTLGEQSWGAIPFGCVSSSGYGDGGYDAFVIRDKDGQIVAVKIEFITEDDDEDEDEDY
jgi:hypothetical protein